MTPVLCPICTRSTLEPIFEEVKIKEQMDGERIVGGLLAYRCTQFGHLFFVRKADVKAESKRALVYSPRACRRAEEIRRRAFV
jgi:hypothetical protein